MTPATVGPRPFNYAVPDIHHVPHLLGAGWQLNSIITVQSGRPINIITDAGGVNSNFVQRPDIVPGVNPILPNWTPTTGYLNPNAFAYPAVTAADPNGYFGNLGRDQIFGPGFWNYDFSTTKNFSRFANGCSSNSARNSSTFSTTRTLLCLRTSSRPAAPAPA